MCALAFNVGIMIEIFMGFYCIIGLKTIIKSLIIMTTLIYKIPPNLPLPKGGFSPLFGKEGCGEIFDTLRSPPQGCSFFCELSVYYKLTSKSVI
jgi:hypothetical protein